MSAVLAPPLGHWHPASSRAGALALPAGALAFEGGAEADGARPNRARKPGIAGDVELGLAVGTGTCRGLMNRILLGGALSSLQFAANASNATGFNAGEKDSLCIHAGTRDCAICSEHGAGPLRKLAPNVLFFFLSPDFADFADFGMSAARRGPFAQACAESRQFGSPICADKAQIKLAGF